MPKQKKNYIKIPGAFVKLQCSASSPPPKKSSNTSSWTNPRAEERAAQMSPGKDDEVPAPVSWNELKRDGRGVRVHGSGFHVWKEGMGVAKSNSVTS